MSNSFKLNNNTTFREMYLSYFPKLVHFSKAHILSQIDAENIVQDVFVYLWENKEVLNSVKNLNAFLFTMVKNRCIDYLRSKTQASGRKYSITDVQEKEFELKLYALQRFDENSFSHEEIESIISNALETLPPRCREIFILSRMEGLKHKDIAQRLNISTNTIEGHISTALKKLREVLKEYI
ncbi:RNA polymerase sigma-70 factor (ECF subfamily) [Parabacteroides sp. PF5-5]|uniref:RNA polymerase sigma-70 factor n=1 Tax=unclassified Parabacteroides TaxID=2649774 RepID=UPI002472EFC6|nr:MULTISPECIES: RNA polymerase sigma-70 factor [unclassified Parabacteroides]MDH6304811.1 RNA polymerase sigma-70 factor (ECF subfamily) [Parabacteroides sp. PH5-39]MDH6315575.1 RNA polymerase sigma-70 factor (ECF subfamily) [Parabacteroides sp. PF5-13]MDH6319235.1 RNA polymerase sigma-70 factor (ECF subfamily) [Parabacteroides sp. PH5-13]MDH6322966.1 RNA polymerase sigma-70 factor (ECF subfamily) [Parabacteroides sp. PH5-8]MDH6326768.1 RNA polymerase sigma-70 factor (ECF subfamily) [Parabact